MANQSLAIIIGVLEMTVLLSYLPNILKVIFVLKKSSDFLKIDQRVDSCLSIKIILDKLCTTKRNLCAPMMNQLGLDQIMTQITANCFLYQLKNVMINLTASHKTKSLNILRINIWYFCLIMFILTLDYLKKILLSLKAIRYGTQLLHMHSSNILL